MYGRHVLGSVGTSIRLSADGRPQQKLGGGTVDWATVTAHSGADLVLDDGVVIKDGEKYIPVGTPCAKITTAEVQTVDLSGDGDPTGGTWPLVVTDQFGVSRTIEGIAWNVSAATLKAALLALDIVDPGLDVSKSGFVYTITFPVSMGNVPLVAVPDTSDLTSATAIAIAIAVSQSGAKAGFFGPYDSSVTDGRQLRNRGDCYVTDWTVKMTDPAGDYLPLIDGGRIYKARLKVGGTNQMTLAQFETLFTNFTYAD